MKLEAGRVDEICELFSSLCEQKQDHFIGVLEALAFAYAEQRGQARAEPTVSLDGGVCTAGVFAAGSAPAYSTGEEGTAF